MEQISISLCWSPRSLVDVVRRREGQQGGQLLLGGTLVGVSSTVPSPRTPRTCRTSGTCRVRHRTAATCEHAGPVAQGRSLSPGFAHPNGSEVAGRPRPRPRLRPRQRADAGCRPIRRVWAVRRHGCGQVVPRAARVALEELAGRDGHDERTGQDASSHPGYAARVRVEQLDGDRGEARKAARHERSAGWTMAHKKPPSGFSPWSRARVAETAAS